MIKIIPTFLYSLFIAGCSLFGIQSEEGPPYDVLEKQGAFEIRKYRPYLVAQTAASGDYETASKKNFFRLFDYISGQNQAQAKISMTAPVLQEPQPEKISMTAPVFQQKNGQNWIMQFVVPSEYTLSTAPKPSDPEVSIVPIPAKKVAVVVFSGFFSEKNLADKKIELLAWLQERKIKPLSEPRSAGYNPPWTVPFLRHNEIQIDIE